MNGSTQHLAATPNAWLEREAVFERFESTWQEQGDADITAFLPPPGAAQRTAILLELVKIDLDYRWQRGQGRGLEDYLGPFPELRADGSTWAELVAAEQEVRQRHGGRAAPDSVQPQPANNSGAAEDDTHRRFGRFHVRRQLGRGSFATVFLAWDPRLRREVALKVPRPELMDHEDLRSRLQREGQSAARLRHPALVPLLEVNQEDGVTYLVYEYIPGPTLAQVLQQTRPEPRQAAQWVACLAEALAYAHQTGIIHRDVKPSNVLMDRDGQPVLADFGLALQADAGETLTRSGDVLGTPAYMSPEQAAGHGHLVDVRTDVYSLGVLFYELLSGTLPFRGTGVNVLHQVLHEEPASPQRHRPGIPLDLETICLKAMAREPSRRYPNAAALATDLRHFLAGEPIAARRTPVWERIWKWSRRHPAAATLLAVTCGAIATIFAVILHANTRLEERRQYAERKQAEAVASLKKARETVERMLTRVATERLRGVPQMEVIQGQLLEDAREVYEDLARLTDPDPQLRFDMARAYEQLAQRYLWVKQLDKAEQCFRQTLKMLEEPGADSPGQRDTQQLAGRAWFGLGTSLGYNQRPRDAEAALQHAVAIQEPLAAAHPEMHEYRRDLAMMYNAFCYLGTFGDNRKREEATYRKALAVLAELAAQYPEVLDYQMKLATLFNNLANLLVYLGRAGEAEPLFREGLAVCTACLTRAPLEVECRSRAALISGSFGEMLEKAGRFDEAETEYLRAAGLREQLMREYPTFPHYANALGTLFHGLAQVATHRKNDTEARQFLERAIQHQQTALKLAPERLVYQEGLADAQAAFAETALRLGDHAAAAEAAMEAGRYPRPEGRGLVQAASLLARCLPLAAMDSRLTAEERDQLTQRYADDAMQRLRAAIQQGYRDQSGLAKDSQWEPLRGRKDWKQLCDLDHPSTTP